MGGMPDDIDSRFAVDRALPEAHGGPPEAEDDDDPLPPLWKQAAGAVAGALLAMVLSGVYGSVAPVVTAWLLPPREGAAAEAPHAAPSAQSTAARSRRAP